MKLKRKIAWALVASMVMNQATPVLAATDVVTGSNGALQESIATGSNAEKQSSAAGSGRAEAKSNEKATSSNAALVDEFTFTYVYDQPNLMEGILDLDAFEMTGGYGISLLTLDESGEYYENLISEEAAPYYQMFDEYYESVVEGQKDASQTLDTCVQQEYADEEDYKAYAENYSAEIGYYVNQAYYAFLYDHPEMFWEFTPSHTVSLSATQDEAGLYSGEVEVTFAIDCDYTGNEIRSMAEDMEDAIASVDVSGDNDYEQLKSALYSLCELAEYDSTLELKHSHSAYGIFVKETAVCEGYAKAFKVICDRLDIPCVLVVGQGGDPSDLDAHMWNYVQMDDNNWYGVDVTFADQETGVEEECFLVGSNTAQTAFGEYTFGDAHVEEPIAITAGDHSITLEFPVLSSEKYETSSEKIIEFADRNLLTAILMNPGADANEDDQISVEELEALTYLNISTFGVGNLSGLEYATNLQVFDCANNHISDISVVSNMKELYWLVLDNNQITDLSPILSCTKLETLTVTNNKLTELPDMTSLNFDLYLEDYDDPEDEESMTLVPIDIFSCNKLTADSFAGKLNGELTEEWLIINSLNLPALTSISATDGSITVEWEYTGEADGFYVYAHDDFEEEWKLVETIDDSSVRSYTYNDVESSYDGCYFFTVSAFCLAEDGECFESDFNDPGINIFIVPMWIETQPMNVAGVEGDTVEFYIEAYGDELTYQWQYYDYETETWCNLEFDSAKTDTLTFEVSSEWIGCAFRCIVTDINGRTLISWGAEILEGDGEAWIEDEVLRNYLIKKYDKDKDGILSQSEMLKIERLTIPSSYKIETLSGLGAAENLTYLQIKNNTVSDIWDLAGLPLTQLELSNNHITDISALEFCTELEKLGLKFNDIQEIPDLTNLTKLQLYANNDRLTGPKRIFLGNPALDSEEYFEGKFAYTLTEAWLADNVYDATIVEFKDSNLEEGLSYLDRNGDGYLCASEMRDMTYGELSNLGIEYLDGLEYAVNLSDLDLSYNNISDISVLENFAYFEILNLDHNRIEDCEALRYLEFEELSMVSAKY